MEDYDEHDLWKKEAYDELALRKKGSIPTPEDPKLLPGDYKDKPIYLRRGDYFGYLIDLIEGYGPWKGYILLSEYLHKQEYTWFVPNDDNRFLDGRHFRQQWLDSRDPDYRIVDFDFPPPYGCTIFEMLVGLALRMVQVGSDDFTAGKYYHILIHNLHLRQFTDNNYPWEGEQTMIDNVIESFLSRTYAPDGSGGGLFPLKKTPSKDQRETEVWYQMQAWMMENHPIV